MDFLRLLFSPEGDGGGGAGGEGDGGSGAGGDGGAGADDKGGVGSGGAGTEEIPSWMEVLPEEAAKDPEVTKYKTADEFYKAYRNKSELLGRKGVIVPKEDAAPEEVEKFYNALGRPEKPEGYKISPLTNLHKSIEITPESTAGYQMLAHKHGLNQKQADGLNKDYLAILDKAAREHEVRQTAAIQSAENALRQEWGAKFESNRAMIAKGILRAGGQEALDAMGGEKGLGNNIPVLKALGRVFALLSEDQLNTIKVEQGGSGGVGDSENMTPEQALAEIDKMKGDPKHPAFDEKHPDHKKAVERRAKLYKIAYPNQEPA